MPVPASALVASDLWDVALPYWNAFWVLNRGRPIASGFGVAQLPLRYSELRWYATDHQLADTVDELDEFVGLLYQMDEVYLKFVAERASQKAKP